MLTWSYKEVQDSATERLSAISYLSTALEGKSRWSNTIILTREELAGAFSVDPSCSRRAKTYYVLGLTLGEVLDKRSLQFVDFVRAAALVTQEADSYALRESLPPVPVSTFSRKRETKRSLFSKNEEEFALLSVPHFAFVPEILQSLLSLLDILTEVYSRLVAYLSRFSPTKEFGPALQEPYTKFNTRIKRLLVSIHKDVENLARSKIKLALDEMMSSLIVY